MALSDDEKEMMNILSSKESKNTLTDVDRNDLAALRSKNIGLDKPIEIKVDHQNDPAWFDAATQFVKGIGTDMVNSTVKSFQLGNLREGFNGTMEEPGPFSPRAWNPFLSLARKSGDLGKQVVDTAVGGVEDASNIYGTAMPVIGLGARFLPGAEAALHQLAIKRGFKIGSDIFPKTPSKILYKAIEDVNLPVDIPQTRQEIAKLIAEQGPLAESLRDTVFAKHAESILDVASNKVGAGPLNYNPVTHTMTQATTNVPKNLPFNDVVKNIQEVGAVVGRMSENRELSARRMKLIYKAMVKDMDAIISTADPASEAAKVYATARQAYKQELVGAAYDEALNAAIQPVMGNDSFDVDKLLKHLRDDEVFKPSNGAIDQETYDGIMSSLAKVSRSLDPMYRHSANDKYFTRKFATLLAGTAAGAYYAGNNQIALGSEIALGIWGASGLMKKLLLHPTGRDFLANVLFQFPPQQQVALAANFINSGRLYDPNAKDYNKRVIEIGKDKVMSIFDGFRNTPSIGEDLPPPSALP